MEANSPSINTMSHEALPLDAPAFARALEELPIDALHSRAAEIQNSIAHLKSSNEQMIPFADEGDQGKLATLLFLIYLLDLLTHSIRLQRSHA